MRTCGVLLLAGALFFDAAPSYAGTDLVNPFRACGNIANDAARLACFDAAVKSLDTREAAAREAMREQAEDNYGLKEHDAARGATASPQKADGVETRPVMDELQSKIVEVFTQEMTGRHMLILENGQMWRETDVSTFRARLRPGMNVSIGKGKIGGYRLKADGKSGFMGVTRVR